MKSSLIIFLHLIAFSAAAFIDPRIVGGDFAKENQFPYQIAILYKGTLRCGGSIYKKQWIVTASHCVLNGNQIMDGLSIRAGSNLHSSGGVTRNVTKSFAHPKYGNFRNDIALMRLDEPLEFNDAIQPIELETKELKTETELTISGWGRESTFGSIPSSLKFNTVTILNKKKCSMSSTFSFDGILCLGHKEDNGACNGDSGGPAVFNKKLVGVANFVFGGCGTKNPDGYAKVSAFIPWIKDTVKNFETNEEVLHFI